jgi:hypothetical protein
MEEITITNMDINTIKLPSFIVFIGKRESGKSWCVYNVLHKFHKDFSNVLIISGSEKAKPFYSDICPSLFIHDEYSDDVVMNFINNQKKICHLKEKHPEKYKDANTNSLIVLDDLFATKKDWATSASFNDIIFNGRHSGITLFLVMQFPIGIAPMVRAQVDLCFIMNEDDVKNIERIHENYGGILKNKHDFRKVMETVTQNYGALVINRRLNSKSVSDKIKRFKATDPKKIAPFRMCHDAIWRVHDAYFDKNYLEKEILHTGKQKKRFDANSDSKKTCMEISVATD